MTVLRINMVINNNINKSLWKTPMLAAKVDTLTLCKKKKKKATGERRQIASQVERSTESHLCRCLFQMTITM